MQSSAIFKVWLLSLLLTVSLTGCDNRFNVRKICSDSPELCNDLNEDGWCRYERAHLIEMRHLRQQQADDSDLKFNHLIALEDYTACIRPAALIKKRERKDIESQRMQAYLNATAELNTLDAQTKGDENPYLLYFHWSRHNDRAAIAKLLKLDEAGELEHYDLQFHLASYYAKYDPAIAINKLKNALSLRSEKDPLDGEIFTTLATLYLQKGDNENAYLWLKIAELAEVKGADTETLNPHTLSIEPALQSKLDHRAAELLNAINEHRYAFN